MMKCEIVQSGQQCKNDAVFIVRTPWMTQLACEACSTSFKRYEVQPLTFTCDWPMGGKECGEGATHYVEVQDFPKTYHRPLCSDHARGLFNAKPIDDAFDPKIVPHKPPVQPQPRVTQNAEGVAHLWCHCGAEGEYHSLPNGRAVPLCDAHAEDFRTTAQTPLRDMLRDVAYAALQMLKEKLQPKKGWSKDVQRGGNARGRTRHPR
jgi:hypothetical protein